MENLHHEEGHEDGDMSAIADIVCKMDMSVSQFKVQSWSQRIKFLC